MNQQLANEILIKKYRNQSGVYMIRCYDGIFKIGQSANLEQRLLTYQGVYWNSEILHVWTCNQQLLIEQQLHLFLAIQCNKIRKGKYELFKYESLEELQEIVEKCKQQFDIIYQQILDAESQGIQLIFDNVDIDDQIAKLECIENQTIYNENQTIIQTNQSSTNTKCKRKNCIQPNCKRQTTHQSQICALHRPESKQKAVLRVQKCQQLKQQKYQKLVDLAKQCKCGLFIEYFEDEIQEQIDQQEIETLSVSSQ